MFGECNATPWAQHQGGARHDATLTEQRICAVSSHLCGPNTARASRSCDRPPGSQVAWGALLCMQTCSLIFAMPECTSCLPSCARSNVIGFLVHCLMRDPGTRNRGAIHAYVMHQIFIGQKQLWPLLGTFGRRTAYPHTVGGTGRSHPGWMLGESFISTVHAPVFTAYPVYVDPLPGPGRPAPGF